MTGKVGQWLQSHGFGKYTDVFAANDVGLDVLADLTDDHLKELGITVGDRIRFKRAIKDWLPEQHGPTSAANAGKAGADAATPATSGEGERRQLTVMFSDLVGSTKLSTRLDPEDMQDVIRAYQNCVSGAVRQFDGFVAKFMGDGVLIYFGYPQAHENDAERAIRAGLAILDDLDDLNATTGTRFGVTLAVRVGIATGPVVVGDIVGEGASEEAAVIGETPNLAARLQALANPNEVVVSSGTRELQGNQFEFEDLGSHEIKGIGASVQAWRVLAEADAEALFETGLNKGVSPLVGRQEELGLLSRSWETGKRGRGQVILLQGEGGIGKSRLVDALRAQITSQPHTWVAIRCSPYHTNAMLYPVIEHMKRVFGWSGEDDVEQKLSKLEAALGTQSLPLDEAVPLFASLMSLPVPAERYPPIDVSATQMREQILDALANWLLEEAERQPVLQVWEDLHWADPTTLDLAKLYIQQSPTVSMLNIFTYRPDFMPPWTMRSHMTPITLNRLEQPEAEALVLNHAGGKRLPTEVVRHIIEKADGVPLYVEELTKSILESDALQEKEDHYEISGSLADIVIPASLHDSLMARLDRLPALREVAQMGAVLGREFAYEMLRGVAGLNEKELRNGLRQLVADELLYQRGRFPKARYMFKHALIQDAAYQSLLKRTRQKCHERVARQLEEQFQDTLEAHPELAAHHHAEAGNFEQAARYWSKAGEQARARSANREAIAYLNNGIDAIGKLPDTPEVHQLELSLQLALGNVNIVAKGHGSVEAEAAYERALDLCRQLGDVPELVPTLFGLWRFFVGAKTMQETQTVAAQLNRLSDAGAGVELKVIADYALGYTALCRGELEAAQRYLRNGSDLYELKQRKSAVYRTAQDPGVACRGYLAMTEWLRGKPETAKACMDAGIELAEQIEDPFSLAYARCFVGPIVMEACGDDLSDMVASGLEFATEGGFSLWIAYGRVQQVFDRLGSAPDARSIDELRLSIDAISDIGVQINVPYYLTFLARAYRRARRLDHALDVLAEAEQRMDVRGELWWAPEVYRLTGEVLLLKEDGNQAFDQFERSLELSRRQGSLSLELRTRMSIVRASRKKAEKQAGQKLLRECYQRFDEGLTTSDPKNAAELC